MKALRSYWSFLTTDGVATGSAGSSALQNLFIAFLAVALSALFALSINLGGFCLAAGVLVMAIIGYGVIRSLIDWRRSSREDWNASEIDFEDHEILRQVSEASREHG